MADEPTIEEAKANLADYCRRMRASEDGTHDSAWPHAAAIEVILASHASLEERVSELESERFELSRELSNDRR